MTTPTKATLIAFSTAIALNAACSLEDPVTPLSGPSLTTAQGNSVAGNPNAAPPPASAPSAPSAPTSGAPSAPATPNAPSGATVFDALTNGTSVGEVSGGQFTPAGWQVTGRGNFIRYRVRPMASGFVEWENLNLAPSNPQRDLFTIMGMWDPSRGDYRENPFRVHIRKLDTQGHNPPYVRLRWISDGDQHDVGWDFLDWNPRHAYKWRLEWGAVGDGNVARVFLDGRQIISTRYGPHYHPNQHWIEMGIEERAETIVGLVFRNVAIGPR